MELAIGLAVGAMVLSIFALVACGGNDEDEIARLGNWRAHKRITALMQHLGLEEESGTRIVKKRRKP